MTSLYVDFRFVCYNLVYIYHMNTLFLEWIWTLSTSIFVNVVCKNLSTEIYWVLFCSWHEIQTSYVFQALFLAVEENIIHWIICLPSNIIVPLWIFFPAKTALHDFQSKMFDSKYLSQTAD